jgi:hypothetical protein
MSTWLGMGPQRRLTHLAVPVWLLSSAAAEPEDVEASLVAGDQFLDGLATLPDKRLSIDS